VVLGALLVIMWIAYRLTRPEPLLGAPATRRSPGEVMAQAWLRLVAAPSAVFARVREATALRERHRVATSAALEAALDDDRFEPAHVEEQAERLFGWVQQAWARDDRDALATMVAEPLMREWYKRLSYFAMRGWENRVSVIGRPNVELVGLVNREGDDGDEVCVRISARLRDVVVDRDGHRLRSWPGERATKRICECWTLRKRDDGRWIVAMVQQRAEGVHVLSAPIVASPWMETDRVRHAALVEQAADRRIDPGELPALISPAFSDDAYRAALDLALVDDRYAPDLIRSVVRQAVEAWVEAVDGPDECLQALASEAAVDALLFAGDRTHATRVVVRGLRVERVTIVAIDRDGAVTVEVDARGGAYVEDRRSWSVLSGARGRQGRIRRRWTLELTADPARPWRIARVD
jgi:predicted lipid-binding transport protein (Tim44 family)